MLIYQNLNKTRLFWIEKRGESFAIVEHDIFGNSVGRKGSYSSQALAEKELKKFADDNGFWRKWK